MGTTRSKLKQFEQELLKDDFEKIRPDVEVKQIKIPSGEETYILCRTVGGRRRRKPFGAALWPRSKKLLRYWRNASQKAN